MPTIASNKCVPTRATRLPRSSSPFPSSSSSLSSSFAVERRDRFLVRLWLGGAATDVYAPFGRSLTRRGALDFDWGERLALLGVPCSSLPSSSDAHECDDPLRCGAS